MRSSAQRCNDNALDFDPAAKGNPGFRPYLGRRTFSHHCGMPLSVDDLLKRVEAACHHLAVPAGDSYLRSYPSLLAHVAAMTDFAPLDEGALVAVAHLAYGWMPTVLHLDFDALPSALQRVEEARQGVVLTGPGLQQVAAAVNHSVVGASKVLHFVNPTLYPIWDRRVYRFCHPSPTGAPAAVHDYQVNNATAYVDYAEVCRRAVQLPAFARIHRAVMQKLQQYPAYANRQVERLRSLEFVMFSAGGGEATKADKLNH